MGRSQLTICHIIEDFQKKRTGVDGKNEKKIKKISSSPSCNFWKIRHTINHKDARTSKEAELFSTIKKRCFQSRMLRNTVFLIKNANSPGVFHHPDDVPRNGLHQSLGRSHIGLTHF